jgi:hypothetical protein
MEKTVVIWTFCWFSTRFLKMVPILISSIKPDNIIPMIAGIKNIPLTKYLIDQVSVA